MKEKLIRRAGIKYRYWMTKEKYAIPDSSVLFNRISSILSKSIEIKKWTERFIWGIKQRIQTDGSIASKSTYNDIALRMIPELGIDLRNNIDCVIGLLKITTDNPAITPLSLKEAIKEIEIISKKWSDIKFRGGILSILIKDVCLTDGEKEVDLGSFRICLNLSDPFDGLTVESINKIKSSAGFSHPHVKSSRLCSGDGGEAMKYALCQGRLEDYFVLVEIILRTYGRDPHEELREWYDPDREGQFFCDSCGEWWNTEDAYYCEECETECCCECRQGDSCTQCDEWRCQECIICCAECGNKSCRNCSNQCPNCQTDACYECMTNCDNCDVKHCSECIMSCVDCDDILCMECISRCDCCEDHYCSSCVENHCLECGVNMCKECMTNCNECDNIICNNCEKNSCEDCGVPMCKSCDERHNCLLAEVSS